MPELLSARACVAAALALTQESLAGLRIDGADADAARDRVSATDRSLATPAWSLQDSWLVVGHDTRVLAISDDACTGLAVRREDALGTGLSEVTGVVPDRVRFRVDEAAAHGLSTTETPVVVGGASRMLRIVIHRLPGTAFGRGAFVVLVGAVPEEA